MVFDYIIIGSGFGGSVSAMRLRQKGYSVLVLERGKRWRDEDFPRTNWNVWKYIWAPALQCFGILQISPFKDVFVLHGSGVGGGSLGYANVLMQPDAKAFDAPEWQEPLNWQETLRPFYDTARCLLGVARNPRQWPADEHLQNIATELGRADTYQLTDTGIFFGQPGQEGQEVPDPFFDGDGPPRCGCRHCGGCMVGCRYNSKNTLVKNYLYFAEKWGAQVQADCEVRDIQPLPAPTVEGARYRVGWRRPGRWLGNRVQWVLARNVIVSAGTLGTLRLLFRCREITRSLPKISPKLGQLVRTNSEAILGSTHRGDEPDYSQGVAITSIFRADEVTAIEPVRYPAGSDLMRLLAGPLIGRGSFLSRLLQSIWEIATHPFDFAKVHVMPGWAQRSTILLVMQTEDNHLRLRLGRGLFTLFGNGLVSETDPLHPIPTQIEIGHEVTRRFAQRINGVPLGSINEGLFNIPLTAHILGGCPIGADESSGVLDSNCEVFNYPGLFVVDGSIMPGNPGVNPSLTITALAEYAMSRVPEKAKA